MYLIIPDFQPSNFYLSRCFKIIWFLPSRLFCFSIVVVSPSIRWFMFGPHWFLKKKKLRFNYLTISLTVKISIIAFKAINDGIKSIKWAHFWQYKARRIQRCKNKEITENQILKVLQKQHESIQVLGTFYYIMS